MGKAVFEQHRAEADKLYNYAAEIAADVDGETEQKSCDAVCREIGGVPVMVWRNISKRLPEILKERAPSPQIALIYLDDVADIARGVAIALANSGFKIFEMSLPAGERQSEQCKMLCGVPDYIKFALAVGSGRICSLAANLCKRARLEFGILATAPSTDCFLTCETQPAFIAADPDILSACPRQLIAAGAGILLSQPLKEFERKVEALLYETANDYIRKADKAAENEPSLQIQIPATADATELFFKLIELSAKHRDENFVSSAEIMADILMRADGSRYLGEYVFIASYLLAGFYASYLKNDCEDVLLPPDKVKTMKLLEKKCGYNFYSLVKRIDIFSANSYFRIKYIIGEYREDLLKSLNSLDFKTAQKFWRRQYADAGFWLISTFSSRELLTLLALSGELAGGILGFAKASGALENYI
jgi:hypothetical protein